MAVKIQDEVREAVEKGKEKGERRLEVSKNRNLFFHQPEESPDTEQQPTLEKTNTLKPTNS